MLYPSNRDVYFDNIKGKLILLVVLGHLLEFCNSDGVFRFLYVFLYSFVMPVFVFVSGLFFKPKIRSVFKYLAIYLIFQLVLLGMNYYFSGKPIFLYDFLVPVWSLWYLLFLIFCYCVAILFERFGYPKDSLLACSIVLFLLSGFIHVGYFLSLQRFCAYFVFFALGVCLKIEQVKKYVAAFDNCIIGLFCIGGIVLVSAIFKADFMPAAFYNSYPYSYFFNYPKWFMFAIRVMQVVLSFIFGLFLLRNTSANKGFYTFCGYFSLLIYLIHSVILFGFHCVE